MAADDEYDLMSEKKKMSKGEKVIKSFTKLLPSQSGSRSSKKSKNRNNDDEDNNSYKPPRNLARGMSFSSMGSITSLGRSRIELSATRKEMLAQKSAQRKKEKHRLKNVQRYRGFSTSISSLFIDEQVVCGAVSWCGLLASSRTEYLLGVRDEQLRVVKSRSEKSPSRILGVLLIISLTLIISTYLIWGFGEIDEGEFQYKYYGRSLHDADGDFIASKYYVPGVMRFCDYDRRFWAPINQYLWSMVKPASYSSTELEHSQGEENRRLDYDWANDETLANNIRFIVCIIFFVVLGLFGRRRRMKTRFAVLKARAQDDKIHFGGYKRTKNENMRREDKYAGACSHTLCGCYPIDRRVIKDGVEYEDTEDDEIAPGFKKKRVDCINSAFSKFMDCCFGKVCELWCQCFSICALAQEAREVRLLIPPKSQRVDFITHQPWNEYFKNIYNLRVNWKDKKRRMQLNFGSHFGALSILSRTIAITFIIATIAIILTEQLNPRAIFSWADAIVLLLTFIQSFIVIGESRVKYHMNDFILLLLLTEQNVIFFFKVLYMVYFIKVTLVLTL